jgi:uncharacterized membrane protein
MKTYPQVCGKCPFICFALLTAAILLMGSESAKADFTSPVSANFIDENDSFETLNLQGGSVNPVNLSFSRGLEINGMNRTGQIVGVYQDSTGQFNGLLYDTAAETLTPIVFPGGTKTIVSGISNNGTIVGFISTVSAAVPFVDNAGTFSVTGITSYPQGINDSGEVTGNYQAADSVAHGFLYSGGSLTTIDFPGWSGNTMLTEIKDNGRILGFYVKPPELAPLLLLGSGLLVLIVLRRKLIK